MVRGRCEGSLVSFWMNAVETARLHLRQHFEGVISIDWSFHPTKYVLDPRTGRAVIPATEDLFSTEDLSLLVPDDGPDSLQLLCEAVELDRRVEPACDRHLIYHGAPDSRGRETRWAMLRVASAKFDGIVLETDDVEFAAVNTLADSEPSMVKALNSRPAVVVAAISNSLRLKTDRPTVVGVDQSGFDVRARFGVLRLEYPRIAQSADDAIALVGEMAAGKSREGGQGPDSE